MMLRKVLVIGGGVGGLATTLALRQAGFDVEIFEGVAAIKEVGAGLAIWSNALQALQRIGLAEAIQAVGMPAKYRCIHATNGELLAKVQIDQLADGMKASLIHLHRGDLQGVLLQAVGEATIHLGVRCIGFRQDSEGVWAQFADGREVHGDLLIGADGVHSVIRQQLFSASKLRLVGQSSWRGVAQVNDAQLAEGIASETWGVGQRVGLIPISHGRAYWFFTRNAPPGGGLQGTASEKKQQIYQSVKNWHEPIPSIIQATHAHTIIHTDLNELEPLDQWRRGRVVLLGDAAHAITPNLGQGACQSLEDAVTLIQCLQEEADIENALNLYEHKRVEHTKLVAAYSRRFGEVVHSEDAPPCQLRDVPFQNIFRNIYIEPLEWILRHAAHT
jgi:2-polyprenyl-6-methoxyphenol hydroxylase-like FAD-dependent oxidoreductase